MNRKKPVISLTTDFGRDDGFVGTMKGVILGICPDAALVDITHEVAPQDVQGAALILKAAYRYFPPGTVHLAVVDPGVGGTRRALVVSTPTSLFAAPDNGLLTFVLKKEGTEIFELTNRRWFLPEVSATFHGRDVFAPAAAHLALGADPEEAGTKISDAQELTWPAPLLKHSGEGPRVEGEVIHVDRFGNLMTNIDRPFLEKVLPGFDGAEVRVEDAPASPLVSYYQAAREGVPAALFNSWGYLEVFCRSANARERLGARRGTPVTVIPRN